MDADLVVGFGVQASSSNPSLMSGVDAFVEEAT